jgi:hypothetical protein
MAMMRKLVAVAGAAEAVRRYAKKHPDKVTQLADRAGNFVDKHTNGKYHSQIDGAVRKLHEATGRQGR